jgi:hypothetical protein
MRISGQVPVIVFYVAKWLPRSPKVTLTMFAVQVGAVLAAAAPVYWLGW